jgi:hypothetical protein
MNKFRFTINTLAVAIFLFAFASIAQAQATRTWVSGVGDDANPCSRTAPCKTFAGAISKTAGGGEIDCLDPGGFGTVTITKSITIDGTKGAGFGSVLAAGTNGINVNDSATGTPNTINVYLKNLSINGATTGLVGINISSARQVWVEDCQIFGFRAGNGNAIRDTRTTAVSNPPMGLWVYDTKMVNNLGSAVSISASNTTSYKGYFNRVSVYGNSSHGIDVTNGAVQITNSDISGNLGNGVRVNSGAQVNVIGTSLNANGTGVNNVNGVCNLADVTIMNNSTGFANTGTSASFGNNNVRDIGAGNTLPAPVGQQ